MSGEHSIGADSLSLARQVDEVCLRFEAAWQAGQRPRIEEHLADHPEPGRLLRGEPAGPRNRPDPPRPTSRDH